MSRITPIVRLVIAFTLILTTVLIGVAQQSVRAQPETPTPEVITGVGDNDTETDGYIAYIGVRQCNQPTETRLVASECIGRVPGVGVTITDPASGASDSCVTNDVGGCSVIAPYGAETILTVDPATVPDGYVVQDEETSYSVPASQAESGGAEYSAQIVLIPADQAAGEPDEQPSSAPDAEASLTPETDGSRAVIFAGDCDTDFSAEPVATLTNVRAPEGEQRGADSASAAETSFTTLDLPLADILAEDHVLVIFDEGDDAVALACGAIGGIVTEDGTLTFGLPAIEGSRFSGVAYLTSDGDQTLATIFLAEDLSAMTPEA